MKEIKVQKESLYLKIFKSNEFDCIIFIYLDKKNQVMSMNYHWGTETIKPKYLEFNGDGEETRLYKMFLSVMKLHSSKVYDLVIASCSISGQKDLTIGTLEAKLAESELVNKALVGKLDKILKLGQEL